MTAVDQSPSPEAYHGDEERLREPFAVTWIANVLRERYVDNEVPDYMQVIERFRDPVLKNISGLRQEDLEAMIDRIQKECDKRTDEGFAELKVLLDGMEEPVFFLLIQ